MTPLSPDIAAVAGKLTKGERAAVQGRILHITKRDALVAKGILTARGGSNWTPLGLALRQHLLENGGG